MANSTEQAIKLALEGLKTLKVEVASLNKQLVEGSSTLHAMLNTDATSFKKIQELTTALNTATKKLNETLKQVDYIVLTPGISLIKNKNLNKYSFKIELLLPNNIT